jgi:ferredoxin
VVFCRACAKTCGPDAITFPDKTETTKMIKAIRKAEKAAEKEAEANE